MAKGIGMKDILVPFAISENAVGRAEHEGLAVKNVQDGTARSLRSTRPG